MTQVTVTCGATEAMAASLLGIVDPGDEVVIFEPFYENYGPDAILCDAKPVFVPMPAEGPIDLDRLAKAFSARTRAIIVCTPNNPTGRVLSRAELTVIAELCQRHDAFAVTDEIYEHIYYEGEHIPIATLPGMADRTITISRSMEDVKFTLKLSLFLVILVIFLFLRNLSATTIPSLALPFSLVGTFAVMYLGGYSLDNLSMMALTLSVGFVVDDAIVMLENIVRHMEMGEGAMEAAISGSGEIGFTILSMTLSLAAARSLLRHGRLLGRFRSPRRRVRAVADRRARRRARAGLELLLAARAGPEVRTVRVL